MWKRIVLTLTLCASLFLMAGCGALGNLIIPEVVYGSGNVVEKSFDVPDFSKVSIAARFTGTVQHGETFSVVGMSTMTER